MPGATAYFALDTIGKPQAGETVLISAAAGAVGQVAGQIAKLKGARVIATAGAADKLDYVTRELGFDAGGRLQRQGREDPCRRARAATRPSGIDVFFDDVGGVTHDAAMANLALRGAHHHLRRDLFQ